MREDPPDSLTDNSLLAEMSDVWKRWHKDQDISDRNTLIAHYLPFAKAVSASIYGARIHDEIEFDDYLQFGTMGLIESIDRYDALFAAKFTSFAYPRIKGAILSGIERLTEKQQQIALKVRLDKERLTLKEEIVTPTPGNPAELLQYLAQIGIGLAIGTLLEGTNMVESENAWIPDQSYEKTEVKQFAARCRHLLEKLTQREREVMQMHYFDAMGFDEIAVALRLTRGRISQLHAQAILRLRTLIVKDQPTDVKW